MDNCIECEDRSGLFCVRQGKACASVHGCAPANKTFSRVFRAKGAKVRVEAFAGKAKESKAT